MKRSALRRILCALLCVTLLISAFTGPVIVVHAKDSGIAISDTETVTPEKETGVKGFIGSAIDFFFRNFGFLGFIFDPYQFTIINQKPVFQWALGFNDIYDVFTWVVNVWADTFKCEFNYEGKDWRIQFWKGGYGVFFATGGEIGIYHKSENSAINHYNCPASQSDWLYLEYTIYNKGVELFTRPSPYLEGDDGPYWWAPGYKVLSICTDFLSSPRSNVVMDAKVKFKSEKMAKEFIKQLEAKGFVENTRPDAMNITTPETYLLLDNGVEVRLIWRDYNEGIF